jgi:anti-sigma B factor antagonist
VVGITAGDLLSHPGNSLQETRLNAGIRLSLGFSAFAAQLLGPTLDNQMTVRDHAKDFVTGPVGTTADSGAVLTVRIRFTPDLPVVRLAGELDLASLHLLADALDSVAATECTGNLVVLDLSGVTFCDVAGLRAVEMCASSLEAADKQLVLYATPDRITKLIAITGVARHLVRR